MWLEIEYRDFYDVPRMFVVEQSGRLFLFDCPFDEDADEYSVSFDVYELARRPPGDSWQDLAADAARLGSIRVDEVRFDSTRRAAIDASALRSFKLADPG